MTAEVGRERNGRVSGAHGSARREREKQIPRRPKRKQVVGTTSQTEDEVEAQNEAEAENMVDEAQGLVEGEEELEPHYDEAESEESPPPASKPRKRIRTAKGKNPPSVAPPPPVTEYGGGPSDLSLLPGFGKHIAAALWRGECTKRSLRSMNNGKKINQLDKPASHIGWFWDVVDASGLRPLLKTNYNHVDKGLLSAFTERWHVETGTFHLPIGEMTITLDDVSCLLHIPITGKMLNHVGTAITVEEGEDMCIEFLNFTRKGIRDEFGKMKGAHISFSELQLAYTRNLSRALQAENDKEPEDDIQFFRECTIRCFLLYLIGATIFTNKSMQYVDVIFLTYLQDLNALNTWNWGASGLAYMFNYLDAASRARSGNIGGYTCFFQAWIMVHFNRFGGHCIEDNYRHDDPVSAKFYPLKGQRFPCEHMTVLDRMEVDEVTFRPYEDHRHKRPFEDVSWYSGWIMCGTSMICPHLPERVLRQYGHVQGIPRHPDVSAKAGMNRFDIEDAFNALEAEGDHYVSEQLRGPIAQEGFETDPGYISWFYRVSHPKIWPPKAGNPPRPPNLEVLIEQDNKNEKCDVFEICKSVRAELREKLDGSLTLEEARQQLEKVYSDLEPVTTYSVQRKKKRHSGEGKKRKKTKSATSLV